MLLFDVVYVLFVDILTIFSQMGYTLVTEGGNEI